MFSAIVRLFVVAAAVLGTLTGCEGLPFPLPGEVDDRVLVVVNPDGSMEVDVRMTCSLRRDSSRLLQVNLLSSPQMVGADGEWIFAVEAPIGQETACWGEVEHVDGNVDELFDVEDRPDYVDVVWDTGDRGQIALDFDYRRGSPLDYIHFWVGEDIR